MASVQTISVVFDYKVNTLRLVNTFITVIRILARVHQMTKCVCACWEEVGWLANERIVDHVVT